MDWRAATSGATISIVVGVTMHAANEIQCPNCGSNDAVAQPNSPAMFRCSYCRTLFAPRFDMRPHVYPRASAPPPPHYVPPQPQQGHPFTNLSAKDTATRYLMYGFISFFVCGAAAPIVWFMGYREARRKGEDPGALLLLSLIFGVPIIGFAMFVLVMMLGSAAAGM